MFITFEGLDKSGKTTIIKLLALYLKKKHNLEIVLTSEPLIRPFKESRIISDLLLSKSKVITPMIEAILFMANRRINLEQVILPALKENKIVLCDRYIDSSFVYQGAGGQIGFEKIKILNEIVTDNKYPDLTFFLDAKPNLIMSRIDYKDKDIDRFEIKNVNFFNDVYEAYIEVSKKFPKRIKIINASRPKEEVLKEIINIIEKNIILKNN